MFRSGGETTRLGFRQRGSGWKRSNLGNASTVHRHNEASDGREGVELGSRIDDGLTGDGVEGVGDLE